MKELLIAKLSDKSLTMGVIGMGYVGLPLAVTMAKAGFHTYGFDLQESKVNHINRGENYIGDVTDEELRRVVTDGLFRATTDLSLLGQVDFVAICVPTPLDTHQQPDISYVCSAAQTISRHLHPGMVVVLESTTYPGTTEEQLKPILEESGLHEGTDFYLGFSPERVDPGNERFKTANTPKVVGAIGQDAQEVIVAIYRTILRGEVLAVSSPAVAEMTKILENTYRNINIGLVNELAMLCHRMHINLWEVIDAAKTKPFGFQPFYPGPGLGGHCIPLDPYYLSWKAREFGFHTSMIESSMMVNDRMASYCVTRMTQLLSSRSRKTINGSHILLLGIAYKQDIDDYRESPALRVAQELEREGAILHYYDPYIREFSHRGKHYTTEPELTIELLEAMDLAVITTAHRQVDYSFVQQHAPLIFDTRNATAGVTPRDNIELL